LEVRLAGVAALPLELPPGPSLVPTAVIIAGIDTIGGTEVAGTDRAAEGRTAYHTGIVEREN
jgi:hypothetical protein